MEQLQRISKFRLTRIFGIGLTLALTSFVVFGQTEKRELPPAQTVEREIGGGETHRYKFALQKDEFYQVRVEQKGIDLALNLFDANGKILAAMDSPSGRKGAETLSFAASEAGDYILEVVSDEEPQKRKYLIAVKYDYTILRTAARTATAQDRRRVEVERVFVEAFNEISRAEYRGRPSEEGLLKLEEALRGWRELQDKYLTDW